SQSRLRLSLPAQRSNLAPHSQQEHERLRRVRQTALPIMGLVALLCAPAIVRAQAQLACPDFTQEPAPPPAPRTAESAVRRFELINAEGKTVAHPGLSSGGL